MNIQKVLTSKNKYIPNRDQIKHKNLFLCSGGFFVFEVSTPTFSFNVLVTLLHVQTQKWHAYVIMQNNIKINLLAIVITKQTYHKLVNNLSDLR